MRISAPVARISGRLYDIGREFSYSRHRPASLARGCTAPAARTNRARPHRLPGRQLRGAARGLYPPGRERVAIARAANHVNQRSFYFADPDGYVLEIYYEMPRALELFANGRSDEDEALPLSGPGEPLPRWLLEDWPEPEMKARIEHLRHRKETALA
jgi:hypothetical protein